MVLTEATGDAELVLWDGAEFGHWLLKLLTDTCYEAWVTKLSTIPQHQLSITYGLCKHHTMLEVANLIAVVGGDTIAHEVRQRSASRI